MELVKSDRYEPQTGQGIVNEISTNTGKPLVTAEEEFAARRGLLSDLSDSVSMLSGDYNRDPRWQMAAWQKGVNPATRAGILGGLAKDIRGLPREQINPTILRSQYKALHKVPAETITENVDRMAFVPELTLGGKQSYAPGSKFDYTYGNHTYHPLTGTSSIKLNPGTNELTHPSQVAMVESSAPLHRTPLHEVTHAMTVNPDNLMKIEDPMARKFMRELIKSSEKQPYAEKSVERIPQEMERWQKSMESWGNKITPEKITSHLAESIKHEAVIAEIKKMIDSPIKETAKAMKSTPTKEYKKPKKNPWDWKIPAKQKDYGVKKYFLKDLFDYK